MSITRMQVTLQHCGKSMVRCIVAMAVADVETRKADCIWDVEELEPHDAADLRLLIREQVQRAVLHEVDEWLRFDGELATQLEHDDVG